MNSSAPAVQTQGSQLCKARESFSSSSRKIPESTSRFLCSEPRSSATAKVPALRNHTTSWRQARDLLCGWGFCQQPIPPQVNADGSNASLEELNKSHKDDTNECLPLLCFQDFSLPTPFLPRVQLNLFSGCFLSTLSKLQNWRSLSTVACEEAAPGRWVCGARENKLQSNVSVKQRGRATAEQPPWPTDADLATELILGKAGVKRQTKD